jgi:hypothetical protein
MDLKVHVPNWVLKQSLLCLDLYDFEPQIVNENYTAPTHLGEYSIASRSMEIVACNCAFSKDH